MLVSVARRHIRDGDVVWDVGANVGLFTFAAAALVGETGQVLALEADTWLVHLLRRSTNLPENHRLNVDVLPIAIAKRVGIARFHVAERGRAANYLATTLGSSQTGGIREVQLVPTVSLDWLLEEYGAAPDFLKIDVEGAENDVLQGGVAILSTVRPIILCEVSSETQNEVTSLLKERDYILYNADVPYNDRIPLNVAAYNTLAYPS